MLQGPTLQLGICAMHIMANAHGLSKNLRQTDLNVASEEVRVGPGVQPHGPVP